MQRIAYISVLLTSLFASWLTANEPDRFELIQDRQTLTTKLQVETEDGCIALGDLFRGVARINGYDDVELKDSIPAARISLDSSAARFAIRTFNRVMDPCVRCDVNLESNSSFTVAIDRESARKWVNDCKSDVRRVWNHLDWRDESPQYGIEILADANDISPRDIVVVVHGLNSRPEDVSAFIPLVTNAGHVPATFRYPNDQPIELSSQLLAAELNSLKKKYPSSNIRLLTHSMGGLVARGVIETELDPGHVQQLIMIGPPNHGSSLARVATFMDCYEFFTSADHRRAGVLVESVSDGLGEATADLAPHSVFLDKLNSRPRNPHVRYTILLGTDGPMEPDEMNSLRQQVRTRTDGNRFVRFVSSKLNVALDNLDEVVQGKGDGAVSCERGRLAGVDDIVELPFSHAGVLSANRDSSQAAYKVIVDRLQK